MAHVQERCLRCGRALEPSERTCPRSADIGHGPPGISWVARYVDDRGAERARRFGRRIDADRFLVSVESAKARGAYVDPAFGRQRLGPWMWSWLEAREAKLKASTAAGYRSLIRTHIVPGLGERR